MSGRLTLPPPPDYSKPIHVKPALYAFYFETLKSIAFSFGYNLVLHGSMNRDLDLIAIPWQKEVFSHEAMVNKFAECLGGSIMPLRRKLESGLYEASFYSTTHHGRIQYVININRGDFHSPVDPQYYLDISIMPCIPNQPIS